MDAEIEILKLKGRIGGMQRVSNKLKADNKEFKAMISAARKIMDDHRSLCAQVGGNGDSCDDCVALDDCWEVKLRDALVREK